MRRKRILFYNYFEDWINIYKVGAVSERTIDKYWLAHRHLKKLAPDLELGQITRIEYQKIINEFAENHENEISNKFKHYEDLYFLQYIGKKIYIDLPVCFILWLA